MKRLVVVGGGISGLAAAHAAADRLEALDRRGGGAVTEPGAVEIVVLEREARVGGKARTAHEGGFTVEWGPTGFLAPDPAIDRLVRAAGLEREVLPADVAAARRFLVGGGRMREVSPHPIRFARSGILGPLGMLRLLGEPFVPGRRDGEHGRSSDESVWDFARRRIGRQAAERLVAPMVLGVYAGDAKRISLSAAFPRLAALEAEHGSLVRGMLARRREASGRRSFAAAPEGRGEASGTGAATGAPGRDGSAPVGPPTPGERSGDPAAGPAGPRGHLTSFLRGMETLPAALASSAARRKVQVRCGVRADRIERGAAGQLLIHAESDARGAGAAVETIAADAVILACEAWISADLLEGSAPALARELRGIPYPAVAVAALAFREEAARGVPRGFGVLIPRGEGYRSLGVLWDSFIFAGRSPAGTVLVRHMFGGTVDPEGGAADDAALVGWARADLARLLGVEAPPVFTHVKRWERAIPQYELGHGERVRAIAAELGRQPGLFLAGNALHGVAFGKAAEAGIAAGEAAVELLLGR